MKRVPSYRLHKPTGQALVCLSGRRIYLGKHNTPESKERYRKLVAEWLAAGSVVPPPTVGKPASNALSVAELALAYTRFAEGYYQLREAERVSVAMRRLADHWGEMDAAELSPVEVEALASVLATDGLSRPYINCLTGCIKRSVRWAARKGLVPPTTWHRVQLAESLKKGRTEAYEPADIEPVPEADLNATMPHLPPIVADMVQLQRLLGCRPGELVQLRPCDIDRSGNVWVYTPQRHKNDYRGKPRRIPVGPRAQTILKSYLVRAAEVPCFSPAESEGQRKAELRERRKTRVQPSQRCRKKPKPKKQPGNAYTVSSYRRVIERAADKADAQAHREQPEVKAEKRLVSRWHPHQLRHLAATTIRAEYGIEASQCVLGHAKLNATEIYAARDMDKAMQVALAIG